MNKSITYNTALVSIQDLPILGLSFLIVEMFLKLGSFTLELLSLVAIFAVMKWISTLLFKSSAAVDASNQHDRSAKD